MNTHVIKTFFTAIVLCLLSFGNVQAADKDSLSGNYNFTIQQAIDFALQNNTEIKNAKVDMDIAKKQVWETTAIGLPQLSGDLKYQHILGDLPTVSFGNDSATALMYDYIFSSLAALGYPPSPDIFVESKPLTLGVKNSTTYSLTLSQLIFSGEYIVGMQASRTFKQLSADSYDKSRLNVKSNVQSNYYSILVLQKNKAILDSSITSLQKISNDIQAMQNAGFMQKTDADQIKLTLNITQNASNALQRQVEVMYKIFKIGLGLKLEDQVTLVDDIKTPEVELAVNALLNTKGSIEQNIDYQMMQTQEKISELSLRREQSKFLPTVSAFYMYQDKTNKSDFDFTINNIIGVNVNIPIISSGQRISKVQQANLDLAKTRNSKYQVSESIKMQIDQTRYNLLNAYDKYKTQSENIKLSKEIYDNTRVKYKEGMVSSMELSQAHQQYLTEQTNYYTALLELINNKINLEKLLNL